MDRTERFYKIQSLLRQRKIVRAIEFQEALEVSRATFRRDLEYLRDRLGMPIRWDATVNGYVLDADDSNNQPLSGFWLNDEEVLALLSLIQVTSTIEPAKLLALTTEPLQERLEHMLSQGKYAASAIRSRIKVSTVGRRRTSPEHFQTIADALLSRQRLHITHFGRSTAENTARDISPQRLVYYRDNWYLDTYCHMRNGLRSFSVDAIQSVGRLSTAPAIDIDESQLSKELDNTYGIFSGKTARLAQLRFSAFQARWVANEIWHTDQVGQLSEDGSYLLQVPFSDEQELMMDILRYGAHVEVLTPQSLRDAILAVAKKLVVQYGSDG